VVPRHLQALLQAEVVLDHAFEVFSHN
jgi:hypothetical protein